MQCKDIPDKPILELLAKNPEQWHFFFQDHQYSISQALPENVPFKLARAKMAQLIKRGLVDGCTCGCRGDFVITEKGKELLSNGKD